jgi:hypothetical protein
MIGPLQPDDYLFPIDEKGRKISNFITMNFPYYLFENQK